MTAVIAAFSTHEVASRSTSSLGLLLTVPLVRGSLRRGSQSALGCHYDPVVNKSSPVISQVYNWQIWSYHTNNFTMTGDDLFSQVFFFSQWRTLLISLIQNGLAHIHRSAASLFRCGLSIKGLGIQYGGGTQSRRRRLPFYVYDILELQKPWGIVHTFLKPVLFPVLQTIHLSSFCKKMKKIKKKIAWLSV